MSHDVIECRLCANKHLSLRTINSTRIECVSGELADGVAVDMIGSVQVIIDNATVTASGVTFEYKKDPVFSMLSPQKIIPSLVQTA